MEQKPIDKRTLNKETHYISITEVPPAEKPIDTKKRKCCSFFQSKEKKDNKNDLDAENPFQVNECNTGKFTAISKNDSLQRRCQDKSYSFRADTIPSFKGSTYIDIRNKSTVKFNDVKSFKDNNSEFESQISEFPIWQKLFIEDLLGICQNEINSDQNIINDRSGIWQLDVINYATNNKGPLEHNLLENIECKLYDWKESGKVPANILLGTVGDQIGKTCQEDLKECIDKPLKRISESPENILPISIQQNSNESPNFSPTTPILDHNDQYPNSQESSNKDPDIVHFQNKFDSRENNTSTIQDSPNLNRNSRELNLTQEIEIQIEMNRKREETIYTRQKTENLLKSKITREDIKFNPKLSENTFNIYNNSLNDTKNMQTNSGQIKNNLTSSIPKEMKMMNKSKTNVAIPESVVLALSVLNTSGTLRHDTNEMNPSRHFTTSKEFKDSENLENVSAINDDVRSKLVSAFYDLQCLRTKQEVCEECYYDDSDASPMHTNGNYCHINKKKQSFAGKRVKSEFLLQDDNFQTPQFWNPNEEEQNFDNPYKDKLEKSNSESQALQSNNLSLVKNNSKQDGLRKIQSSYSEVTHLNPGDIGNLQPNKNNNDKSSVLSNFTKQSNLINIPEFDTVTIPITNKNTINENKLSITKTAQINMLDSNFSNITQKNELKATNPVLTALSRRLQLFDSTHTFYTDNSKTNSHDKNTSFDKKTSSSQQKNFSKWSELNKTSELKLKSQFKNVVYESFKHDDFSPKFSKTKTNEIDGRFSDFYKSIYSITKTEAGKHTIDYKERSKNSVSDIRNEADDAKLRRDALFKKNTNAKIVESSIDINVKDLGVIDEDFNDSSKDSNNEDKYTFNTQTVYSFFEKKNIFDDIGFIQEKNTERIKTNIETHVTNFFKSGTGDSAGLNCRTSFIKNFYEKFNQIDLDELNRDPDFIANQIYSTIKVMFNIVRDALNNDPWFIEINNIFISSLITEYDYLLKTPNIKHDMNVLNEIIRDINYSIKRFNYLISQCFYYIFGFNQVIQKVLNVNIDQLSNQEMFIHPCVSSFFQRVLSTDQVTEINKNCKIDMNTNFFRLKCLYLNEKSEKIFSHVNSKSKIEENSSLQGVKNICRSESQTEHKTKARGKTIGKFDDLAKMIKDPTSDCCKNIKKQNSFSIPLLRSSTETNLNLQKYNSNNIILDEKENEKNGTSLNLTTMSWLELILQIKNKEEIQILNEKIKLHSTKKIIDYGVHPLLCQDSNTLAFLENLKNDNVKCPEFVESYDLSNFFTDFDADFEQPYDYSIKLFKKAKNARTPPKKFYYMTKAIKSISFCVDKFFDNLSAVFSTNLYPDDFFSILLYIVTRMYYETFLSDLYIIEAYKFS